MCIIIIKQKGKVVPREILKTSSRINPHGLGIVWLDTFETTYHKSKEFKVLDNDRPYIAHFRYATVGKVCRANTHPFVCGHNKDELFMMNGTVHGYGNKNMTDTEDLAIKLGRTPRHTWKQSLAKFDARFVAINTRTRSFQIFNKHLYTLRDGVWYSKTNVLQDNLMAVYGTLRKGNGNYYRYLRNAKHIGTGKTKYKYPMISNGIPYVIPEKGKGHNVVVDVFKVSETTLQKVDGLEGHPKWYKRRQILVEVNGKEYPCWLYFNDGARTQWNGSNHIADFNNRPKPKYTYHTYHAPTKDVYKFEDAAPVCTQIDMYNEFDRSKEKPICIDCYHDLEFDGFANYHCNGCDGWFTEEEVLRFQD
tara:strand:+ start:2999 stop:4087 length:1089 start_codon:yes stop_codon:yes gene_type:complete